VARDAIARQYDVEKNTVRLVPGTDAPKNYQSGTITFQAKKGKSINLDKIRESIWATRLSGGTNMQVTYLEVTAKGEVVAGEKELLFKIGGTGQQFVLGSGPNGNEALRRIQEAVDRGEKIASVTGRVNGWSGRFPTVLRDLEAESGKKQLTLFVTDFATAK